MSHDEDLEMVVLVDHPAMEVVEDARLSDDGGGTPSDDAGGIGRRPHRLAPGGRLWAAATSLLAFWIVDIGMLFVLLLPSNFDWFLGGQQKFRWWWKWPPAQAVS